MQAVTDVYNGSSHQVLLLLNNNPHSTLLSLTFTNSFLLSVSPSVSFACVAWERQSEWMLHLTTLQSREKTKQENQGALFTEIVKTSRFIMTLQTNPTTCLPITERHACLLITVQLALKQSGLVESPWSPHCVGC